ncbi:MAG: polysaccharide lyase family 7 protein, partial [Flavobacteriaceae bacterium]
MKKRILSLSVLMILAVLQLEACNTNKRPLITSNNRSGVINKTPSKVIPFFQHWNLILGDGSNVGQAIDYENKDFFYTSTED